MTVTGSSIVPFYLRRNKESFNYGIGQTHKSYWLAKPVCLNPNKRHRRLMPASLLSKHANHNAMHHGCHLNPIDLTGTATKSLLINERYFASTFVFRGALRLRGFGAGFRTSASSSSSAAPENTARFCMLGNESRQPVYPKFKEPS